jgi:hypothetical protein
MSLIELIEHPDRLEIRSPMRVGMRILLAALGFFPLIAPYELLIKIEWQDYLHPFFFLAAFIAAGATALSLFFFFAAVAGLSSQIIFDRSARTVSHSSAAPIVRPTTQIRPLSAVRAVEVGLRDWSDSAPSYYLRVIMSDGDIFESGSASSRAEIESIRVRVDRFLAADGDQPF